MSRKFLNTTLTRKIGFVQICLSLMLAAVVGAYFYNALRIDPFGNYPSLVDDAYIHLRFAHNVAGGYGFVWNRGDVRVEGFTSLLDVLILALIEKAGLTPLAYVPLMGVFFAVISLALALLLLQWVNPGQFAENLTGVILLGLSPQLWFWSTSGLETTLFAALLLASVLAYIAYQAGRVPSWGVGLMFGLCALTRPEGALVFGLTLVFDAALVWRAKTGQYKDPLWMAAAFAAIFVPVFLWKWVYFGYPLPNTYYAKTGAGWIQIRGGWDYLAGSLQEIFAGSNIPLLLAALTFRKLPKERLYILFMFLSSCMIIVLEGGDHFPDARFVTQILPLLFILVTFGISELTGHLGRINRALLLGVLVIVAMVVFNPRQALSVKPGWAPLPRADHTKFQYLEYWSTGFSVMGKTMRHIASPEQSIALIPIGAVGYFSDMKVYDMVGLTDPYIAHQPFDPAYVITWRPGHDKGDGPYILQKRPDYIQLVDSLTSQPLPGVDLEGREYKSVVEIWNSPEFLKLYEFDPIQVEGGWYYNLYRLKSR